MRTIKLSLEASQLLQRNGKEPVRAVDPATNAEYILVPAELYERVKGLLEDDGDWTPEERLQLLAESGRRAGWDEASMDDYDNYDESRKKPCP